MLPSGQMIAHIWLAESGTGGGSNYSWIDFGRITSGGVRTKLASPWLLPAPSPGGPTKYTYTALYSACSLDPTDRLYTDYQLLDGGDSTWRMYYMLIEGYARYTHIDLMGDVSGLSGFSGQSGQSGISGWSGWSGLGPSSFASLYVGSLTVGVRVSALSGIPSVNIKQATIISDFDNPAQWSLGTGATIAADDKLYGLYALKLSTSGTAVADMVTDLNLTSGYLGAWIKTDAPARVASFAIWCQVGGNWSKFFQHSGGAGEIIGGNDSGVWLHHTFARSMYSLVSGAVPTDWSKITGIRFSLQASANLTVNVWVDRLEQYERMLSGGFFTMFIDDEQYPYQAWTGGKAAIAASYNFWPTWAFYGAPTAAYYWSALQNWIASGSDCAVHSYDGGSNGITAADDSTTAGIWKIEWNVAYAKLPFFAQSLGRFTKFFVFNGGSYSPIALEMANEHYVLARPTGGGYNTWPPRDRMRIGARIGNVNLASLQSMVSTAVSNGEWLVFYNHGWLTPTMDQIASWAYEQGYSMYNLSTAWSLLRGFYPREIILDNPVVEAVHETWTQVPSSSTIVSHAGMAPENLYQVWAYDGGVYTDETTATNNDTANDMTLMPADGGVSGDAYYFGFSGITPPGQFSGWVIWINMGTAGSGTPTLYWEYYDGSAFRRAEITTDGTSSFRGTIGWKKVSVYPNYGSQPDWAQCSVNSVYGWWIRARLVDASYSTVPSGTRAGYTPSGGLAVTGFSQPVPPRCLWAGCTSVSGGTGGVAVIYGRDAMGAPLRETLVITAAGACAFASISAISMFSGPIAEDLLIATTSRIGLSRPLMTTQDALAWQINASLGTITAAVLNRNLSPGYSMDYNNLLDLGTQVSGDEYHFWYVSRRFDRKPKYDFTP